MTSKNINQLISELKLNLPIEIDHSTMDGKSSVVTKVITLRAGLLHRAYDLATAAHRSSSEDNVVSGNILTRAILETVAVTAYLSKIIKTYIKTHDIEVLNTKLMRLLFGSQSDEACKPINIMECIRLVDKEIDGFMTYYEILSAFSHPNFNGTCGFYGELNGNKPTLFSSIPNDIEKHKSDTINLICLALDTLTHYNMEIAKNIDSFIVQYKKDKLK